MLSIIIFIAAIAAGVTAFVCFVIVLLNVFLGGTGGNDGAERATKAIIKYGIIGTLAFAGCLFYFTRY
jgi:hypothetical protein